MALKKAPSKWRQEAPVNPDVVKAQVELRKEPLKRLNVEISANQHRALKLLATKEGVSIKDLVVRLIGDELNRSGSAEVQ
jgi:predicted HicB family RNase H-like nuclease